MKCVNCGTELTDTKTVLCNCHNNINEEVQESNMNVEKNKKNKYKIFALISFILAMIPILLITYCYIYSGGSFSDDGKGVIFWYIVIYFGTIGFPISFLSVFFVIKSFKIKKSIFSIISIIFWLLPLFFIIISIVVAFFKI